MPTRPYYSGGLKPLTLKRARELAVQVFGTAKGLKKPDSVLPGRFQMQIGSLDIRMHNDDTLWCIKICVDMPGYGCCVQLHDPDTLQQDFAVEERYRRECERDRLNEWVEANGPEWCHAAVDRIWNKA